MVTKVVFFVFVFSCQNLCLSTSLKEEIIVKTSVGTFRGIKELLEIDNTNKSVNSFKGIRYGVAPVGELRFKKPFPYKAPNSETLNATKLGPACFQAWHRVWESEDCLFLNVWAPTGNEKLPVMFFIHGGGLWNETFWNAGTASNFYSDGLPCRRSVTSSSSLPTID